LGRSEGAQHGQRGGGELREPFGDAGTLGPVSIFVPPAIFGEEQAVFDLPMSADRPEQFGSRDLAWIETGQKIAGVGQPHLAVVGDHVPINTHSNLRPGKRQRFSNVVDVVQIEPESPAINGVPFFSTVWAAGGRS